MRNWRIDRFRIIGPDGRVRHPPAPPTYLLRWETETCADQETWTSCPPAEERFEVLSRRFEAEAMPYMMVLTRIDSNGHRLVLMSRPGPFGRPFPPPPRRATLRERIGAAIRAFRWPGRPGR